MRQYVPGIAPTYDNGASSPTWTETVTGSFGNGTVSFATVPVGGGATFKVTNAPMDNTTVHNVETTWTANEIEIKVSKTIASTSDYKNHGDYVKPQGGGDDAAHSCIGMPINSSK